MPAEASPDVGLMDKLHFYRTQTGTGSIEEIAAAPSEPGPFARGQLCVPGDTPVPTSSSAHTPPRNSFGTHRSPQQHLQHLHQPEPNNKYSVINRGPKGPDETRLAISSGFLPKVLEDSGKLRQPLGDESS